MDFSLGLTLTVAIFIASLNLSLNSLTLMSGRALSHQVAARKLQKLITNFWLGNLAAFFLTLASLILIISQSNLVLSYYDHFLVQLNTWSLVLILLISQILIMAFLKILQSTSINPWTPSAVRDFMRQRCLKTDSSVEALSLGITSVLLNLGLMLLPLTILSLDFLSQRLRLYPIIGFSLLISLPHLLIKFLISRRIKISQINRFLIEKANFLQVLSFLSLLVLGIMIIIYQSLGNF